MKRSWITGGQGLKNRQALNMPVWMPQAANRKDGGDVGLRGDADVGSCL